MQVQNVAESDRSERDKLNAELFAKIFRAFLEASNEIQAGIREMISIINDPETDDDEREMALFTLAEALFPEYGNDKLGIGLEEAQRAAAEESPEGRAALEEVEREEAVFAERLKAKMEERGLNQVELAKKAGVGQSAISMMLKRTCRPQGRTVRNLAEALGVDPHELWPFE